MAAGSLLLDCTVKPIECRLQRKSFRANNQGRFHGVQKSREHYYLSARRGKTVFVRSESASQNNRKTATSSQRKAEPAKGLAGWWRKLIGAEDAAESYEGSETPSVSGPADKRKVSEAPPRPSSGNGTTSAVPSPIKPSEDASKPLIPYPEVARLSEPPGAAASSAATTTAKEPFFPSSKSPTSPSLNGSSAFAKPESASVKPGAASPRADAAAPKAQTAKREAQNASAMQPSAAAAASGGIIGSQGPEVSKAGKAGDAASTWDDPAVGVGWDGGKEDKPSATGYALLAGMILLAVLLTTWLFKGVGHVRSRRKAKSGGPPPAAAAAPVESEWRPSAAGGQGSLGSTSAERGLAASAECEAPPELLSPRDGSSETVEDMGDFRSFDKGELDDMRDAADRQAAKAERKRARNDPKGANPAAVGPINDGKQRMWLPDEGWVEVEAVEAQEGTPDEREAGYNAYSDDPATAAEDMERAEREKAVSEEGEEQTENRARALSSPGGGSAQKTEGDGVIEEGRPQNSKQSTSESADLEQASVEAVHGSESEGYEAKRVDDVCEEHERSEESVRHTKQEPKISTSWDQERWKPRPLPPLPEPGAIQRPPTAVDPASLQHLPSDLSLQSLRDRTSVAMRASLAAGDASHRAASYAAAATSASSRAAEAAQRAAEAAGHAQTALDRAAAEAVDEAVARTEAALTDAAEAESRAAAAAAVATAHEEVSVGQTNLAEQAAKVEAPQEQNILQKSNRQAQSLWYRAKHSCQRAGNVLMGWLAAAWLWLGQAWNVVAESARGALRYIERAWLWLRGCASQALQSVKGLWRRPSPA